MPEIYDPLNLIELEPIALGAAQEERASKKKGGSYGAPPKEPREPKRSSLPTVLEAPAAPPEPVPPSPEQVRLMLDKIGAYKERFAHLKSRNKLSLKSTPEEIEDELHYLELQLGSSQGVNFGASGLCMAMTCLERSTDYWNPLNLDLSGLSTVTQQNMHEFQPIIDELMIKYNTGMYTPPEWRLALAIGATVVTVHAANQNPEIAKAVRAMGKAVNKPPNADAL